MVMGANHFMIFSLEKDILGGGFKYFLFSPLPGEMIQFDEHIFQRGWFNHHLALCIRYFQVFECGQTLVLVT